MEDDAAQALARDQWEIMPPKSSFARTHSSLLISPNLLHRQQTIYEEKNTPNTNTFFSPIHTVPSFGSLHRMNSNTSDGTPVTIIKGDHIAPDWYHLTLQKIHPSYTSHKISALERQQTVIDTELTETTKMIDTACKLRQKWLYKSSAHNGHIGALVSDENMETDIDRIANTKLLSKHDKKYSFKIEDGIVRIFDSEFESNNESPYFAAHSFETYLCDLEFMHKLMNFGPAKTLSYTRLKILQRRFQLHLLLNRDVEMTEASSVPYRDFYNVRKIDNNIHISAGMSQKYLLQFMRDKHKSEKERVVTREGQTLSQVFEALQININELSVDKLDVHSSAQSTFQRFDKFDAKYNPLGQKTLRTLFLKIENAINGQYLAEIIRHQMTNLEKSQYIEYRLTVRGHTRQRWNTIAKWVCAHRLYEFTNAKYIIQIPRIYSTLKREKFVTSFHEMMRNVFAALFEVTLAPQSNPELHLFLQKMVGIDVVGDESVPQKMRVTKHVSPQQWNDEREPPYLYYLYYVYANLYKLNRLRERLGFNTFALRPQSGEDGSVNHLASAFLLAQSINHGIRLYYSPILQYLYYLEQIGIAVSPLSNSILSTQYDRNPFPRFFQRGLNVSLSTDNPLLIHYTKDPLLEEYSIAAQVYGLTSIDLCEIARNSVLQSGWDRRTKQAWIGKHYCDKRGALANDIYRTNVPNARVQFRYFLVKEEREFIKSFGGTILSKAKHFTEQSIPYFDIRAIEEEIPSKATVELSTEARLSLPVCTEVTDCEDKKEFAQMSDTIHCHLDVLLGMIDSLTPKNTLQNETVKNGLFNILCVFGEGTVLEQNNEYYTLEVETMVCRVLRGECDIIAKKDNIALREVLESDMHSLCALCAKESKKEILCVRYLFDKEYLRVLTLNMDIIGFVSGKRVNETSTLLIDLVMIDAKYRKKGYGTQMMQKYIRLQRRNANSEEKCKCVENISLCCSKHLIVFFESVGLELVGECPRIEHRNDLCYHMTVNV